MNPLRWLPGGTGNVFYDVLTWWFFRPKKLGDGMIPEGFKDKSKKRGSASFEISFTIPPFSDKFWNFIPWINNETKVSINNNTYNTWLKTLHKFVTNNKYYKLVNNFTSKRIAEEVANTVISFVIAPATANFVGASSTALFMGAALSQIKSKEGDNNMKSTDRKSPFKGKRKSGGGGGGGRGGKRRFNSNSSDGDSAPSNQTQDTATGKGLVSFSTGITPGILVDSNQETTTEYSPLYTGNFKIVAQGTSNSYYNERWTNQVFKEMFYCIQRRINFALELDQQAFTDAIVAVINSLQVYYTFDSIIKYSDNPSSQNDGIRNMRDQITADMLDKHKLLKWDLEGFPCPPNLLRFIYWFYQLYSHATLPGSPILKANFQNLYQVHGSNNNWTEWDSPIGEEIYDYAMNQLYINSTTLTTLAKAVPGWVIGTLPESSPVANYDAQWLTWWTNSPSVYAAQQGIDWIYSFYPSVSDEDQDFPYHMHTNELDGALIGMNFFNSGGVNQMGLIIPHLSSATSSEQTGNMGNMQYYNSGVADNAYSGKLRCCDSVQRGISIGKTSSIYYDGSWQYLEYSCPGAQIPMYNNIKTSKYAGNELVKHLYNLEQLRGMKD